MPAALRPSLVLIFCTFLLLVYGCRHKPVVVKRAFYYWKTANGYLESEERDEWEKLRAYKLYVKMFEVDRNPLIGPIPVAKAQLYSLPYVPDSVRPRCEMVPTVFINNDALSGLSFSGIDSLADNISFLTRKYMLHMQAERWLVQELQIDCDWSAGNKETYFGLLRAIKQKWGNKISCTLRLYPYKYRDRMGIPPVDRVMLMCYNLLNPLSNPDKNTILDIDELKGYLGRKSGYPLPLDVALPVYAQMQLYQAGRFAKLIHARAEDIMPLLKQTKPFWYEVSMDTVVDDTYLRRGDAIKYEAVSPGQLGEVTRLLHDKLPLSDTTTVSLFHLDNYAIRHYSHEALEAVYTAFAP